MGANEGGERYDGIHVIFRDADQIDRFIHNFHNPPVPKTEAEKRVMSNIQAAQAAMQKLQEQENNYAQH